MRKRVVIVLLMLIACVSINTAQTKAKPKAKPKTTTKAPVKKKAAPKPINVYVCTSDKDKFYHKRIGCAGLSKCSGEIKNIKDPKVLSKYKRKSCSRCFSK